MVFRRNQSDFEWPDRFGHLTVVDDEVDVNSLISEEVRLPQCHDDLGFIYATKTQKALCDLNVVSLAENLVLIHDVVSGWSASYEDHMQTEKVADLKLGVKPVLIANRHILGFHVVRECYSASFVASVVHEAWCEILGQCELESINLLTLR